MTTAPPISDSLIAATGVTHQSTTLLHAFIYFSPEASEEYAAVGADGRAQYFGSRTAAMGPLCTEMVIATFYNFSPDVVAPAMDGLWDVVTADELQAARWRGARRVLDAHVRPVMSEADIAEAVAICERSIAGLSWAGRPLAAGNQAALAQLTAPEFAGDDLLKLWQLVTVLREWRGDAHIGLLVTEPLDAAECTVISAAMMGRSGKGVRSSRGWNDAAWDAAEARLIERNWLDDDGAMTPAGTTRRESIEHRTNELSAALWHAGEADALRLHELVRPASKALLAANYFAAIGRPAR